MRALHVLGSAIGLLLLGAIVLLAMIVVHAPTALGREAIRQYYVTSASAQYRGTVEVDAIEEVSFDRWVMRGYRVIAPNGEHVLHTPEMVARWDVGALLDGEMRYRPAWFENSTIRITPGPGGQVNLAYALEVPDGRFFIPTRFDDVRVENNTIHVDLPGKPAVTMREVYGLTTLELYRTFRWRMDGYRGTAELPLGIETGFSEMNGRLRTDHAHPLIIRMVIDLPIAEPGVRMDYHAPGVVGEQGEPYFELDLPVDVRPGRAEGGGGEAEQGSEEGEEET